MKKQLRILACLLATLSFGSLSACSFTGGLAGLMKGEEGGFDNPWEDESYYDESWAPASDWEEDPQPSEPDPDKVVSRTETDAIGHKVVYYTDGTYDDLGRVTPLNFDTPVPTLQYGYAKLGETAGTKGRKLCQFYELIYQRTTNFHNSATTLYSDENGDYVFTEVNYSQFGLTKAEALAVWKVFGDENPLYYWIDGSLYINETAGTLILLVDPLYASYSVRQQANESIREMALDCDRYLSGLTTLTERALTIYDYIAWAIDYAYESDGVTVVEDSWAYNIAGGAMYRYGVCEAYAELYDYFCWLFGIECLNVVGKAGDAGKQSTWGGHAWNYLTLEDGKCYAVDITWADQNYLYRNYFGQELSDYTATHSVDLPTSNWGLTYQCELPTVSGGLAPVRVSEENGKGELVPSLDAATKKMTNANLHYIVTLYPHTAVTGAKRMFVYPDYAKFYTTTALPKVSHITFQSDTDPRYQSKIDTQNVLTLQSNVTMRGITYTPAKWQKGTYSIFTK